MQPECKFCEEIQKQDGPSRPSKISKAGKLIMGVGAGMTALIYGIAIPFISPGFRRIRLPYIPATDAQINNIISCLSNRSGSVIDLGSGDGRVVISVMQKFKKSNSIVAAHGVELNRWLVWYSRWQSRRQQMPKNKVMFYKRDIFKTNLTNYKNIVVFGVESLMVELEGKLEKEMRDDAILLACRFPLPNWTAEDIVGEGIDKVWIYRTPFPNVKFDSQV